MYILVLFLAAMQEPGDEPPAKRTRIAFHAGANTAIGSLKLRLLVLIDTEASASVDASRRLAWALLGHSWARTTLNYDVHCKIGNGCETQSPRITQNINAQDDRRPQSRPSHYNPKTIHNCGRAEWYEVAALHNNSKSTLPLVSVSRKEYFKMCV